MTTQAPLFGQPLSKPRRSRPGADPRVKQLVNDANEIAPGLVLSFGKQAAHARRLLDAKFEPAVVLDCLRFLLTDQWFAERAIPVDLGVVGQRIGAWVKAGCPAVSVKPDGARRATPQEAKHRETQAYWAKWQKKRAEREGQG